ncbi:MAG: PQQ-binding-like beta-propeller repeat protein [Burkholderiaceae bacterium]|jgi:outer membrane protein assembly factor BamB|nr:PQQ-binding-like beta-propeller repeat protein [Burkholderiaceae bacterium]
MTLHTLRHLLPAAHRAALILSLAPLAPALAQPADVQPLRSAPTEKLTIRAGVRDFGPAVLVNGTLYVGNPTGGGALFAIDPVQGKVKWTFRPAGISGSVSTRPAVVGHLAIAPHGAANPGAVVATNAITGKEVWRALDPSAHTAVVAEGSRVFAVSKACTLHALDAASGRELWQTPLRFVPGGACTTSPVVRDGSVYAQIMARAPEGTAGWPDARYMAAFDAATGQERWRHRPLHPEYRQGAAPRHPVVTDSAVYFAGENALYALDRATGQPLFAPVLVDRMVDGRKRPVALHALIDAGDALVGATEVAVIAFDKGSGRVRWELPGRFHVEKMAFAVAGPVLYFQGALDGAPASPGTLHALDMRSATRLWSFTRQSKDPSWSFGYVLPVDNALWVDGHASMIKLQ